ncbi:hypothetical protein [Methylobacterium sp. yr596]|uniref:hypothetical protein n=1 Tax=Methylobacterium sp. yr596 TaxID=1761800 RepID=UPI0008EFD53B|nr:hypothetical protein [Methylobacterium sp. yr596]SFF22273.1 hypothetical protein SAMN04487844_1126 [Methylobacterium sp. yr596]
MSEPAEEKLARLTRERDEMATQASACAEEVDRVRVEIGAVQAELERLKQVCTGLGADLRVAESERDDARKGEEIWALRCGVVLGRTPIQDAPADLGRLPAETFWRAARVDHVVRWGDRTFEERQRWAYAEGACIEKARGQLPEVAKLIAERDVLLGERNSAQREAQRLREGRDEARAALAESERKRVEAVEALKPFALAAEHYEPDEGDGDHSLWADDGLRVRHLIAALLSALIAQEVEHGR